MKPTHVGEERFLALPIFAGETELCRDVAHYCMVSSLKAGHEIVAQSEISTRLYFVLEGQVRVNVVAKGGRQITYQLLDAGELFGELACLDDQGRSASVVAELDSVVGSIDRADVRLLLEKHPHFVQLLLARLTRLARWLTTRVFEYHTFDVKGRIISELLRSVDTQVEANPTIVISDADMASRVGTTRANVSRIFAELKRSGYISRSAQQIVVKDSTALGLAVNECEFQ